MLLLVGELNFMKKNPIICTKRNGGFTIIELLVSLCICGIILCTTFVIISNVNSFSKNVYISNEEQYQLERTMNTLVLLIKESSGIKAIYETRQIGSKNKIDETKELEVGKIIFNTLENEELTIRKHNTEANVNAIYYEEKKMILGENITSIRIKPKEGSFRECKSILITMTSSIGERNEKLRISNEIPFKNR